MATSKIAQDYLDGTYLAKNPSFHVEDSPWKATQILKMLERSALRPSIVAEVGCGAGEILVQLAKSLPEARFDGYELSPQGFGLCQQRQCERIRYFNRDLLAEPERFYDLVLCIDVFEHIEDYFGFLRGLKYEGREFIFHIPLDMNAQMVARDEPLMHVRNQVGHLHYFSRKTALATLIEFGYKITAWFYTPSGAVGPKTPKTRLLNLSRKLFYAMSPGLTVRLLGGYSLLVHATRAER